ncbi:MAG: glycosyltransferase, partial [bacterium]|nr:glycosyltransferase [bacterium]
MKKPKPPCILYVASYPPRECGIATFTQDLTNALDKEFNPAVKSKVLAINDNGTSIYNYPRKVRWQIREVNMEDYLQRANEINQAHDIKVVNVQHEYGIFGGDEGNYLLPLLELIKKPVVVTFHTVLPRPTGTMRAVTKSIIDRAQAIVVMTKTAKRLLQRQYKIKDNKIQVIPHGVHHVPFPSKRHFKKKLNLADYTVLSTFGMLNSDKGIEYAIEALPELVKKYPKLLYLVIGATHPVVRRHEGEKYRNKLKRIVEKNGLKENVKFYDKYLSLPELIDYLRATDIYISPTLNPKQSVSGTISYALSCACPVVSTQNQYAKDVITSERGRLVRFHNAGDIKNAIDEILSDRQMRTEMKKNAYFYSRHMTWQNVALSYFKIYNDLAKILPREPGKLPKINLAHVKNLTDEFGMIQFATHTKPDIHSGYCIDDNARALLAMAQLYHGDKTTDVLRLSEKYLKFIKFTQKRTGRFYNFVNYNRTFDDPAESEDAFGRALWALGYVIGGSTLPDRLRRQAWTILKKSYPEAIKMQSLRAISFSIIGLTYTGRNSDLSSQYAKKITILITRLAERLTREYKKTVAEKKDSWNWFENFLTYSNYKLPEALLRASTVTGKPEHRAVAEESLKFLSDTNFIKNYFSPIGQDGWYFRGGKRSWFDQQPEDASSAVEALVAAYRITKKKQYLKQAQLAFDWFLGKNHLNQMIYDEATGGCYDGLGKHSINFNQGAESTISYLLARLA